MYYATPLWRIIVPFASLALPNAENVPLWLDSDPFHYCGSLLDFMGFSKVQKPLSMHRCYEFTFKKVIMGAKRKLYHYQGSYYIDNVLADVSRFGIPERYAVVVGASRNARNGRRNFDSDDWECVLRWLDKKSIVGVVLQDEGSQCPVDGRLINLSGATSLCEAVEIVKRCRFYLGIDSAMSVIASKVLRNDHMMVKLATNSPANLLRSYWVPMSSAPICGVRMRDVL